MHKLLSFLFALPLWATAQDPQNGLLWRISPPEGGPSSYLLGTVHSRDARAYTSIALAQTAMDACQSVYGEVDMEAAKGFNASIAASVMLPGGQTLKDLYSLGKYKRVEKALREKLGPMYVLLSHMKPLLLSAVLTEESMGKDSSRVLDEYLQVRARDMGKRAGGIETMAEQLAAMDAIPLKDQADMLYETVRSKGQAKEMDRLLNAYAKQDLGTIGKLMKDGGMSDAFSRPLLTERNVVMAQRIDSLMHDGTALFAVGAAHLPGEKGVLQLLKARGLEVKAVRSPADIPQVNGQDALDADPEEIPPNPPVPTIETVPIETVPIRTPK